MYSIKVRENILIAHSLAGEVFGPAQNMHGATYLVDAEFFTDKLNEYNIIMDLGVVTNILKDTLNVYNYKNLDEVDEFKDIISDGGFVRCGWNGDNESEKKIKDETKATIRCIPFDEKPEGLRCVLSEKPAKHEVIFAKAY